MSDIKRLVDAKTEALNAIKKMAQDARELVDIRETQAMKAIEAAKTAEEVYRLMGFIAAGESFEGRIRG